MVSYLRWSAVATSTADGAGGVWADTATPVAATASVAARVRMRMLVTHGQGRCCDSNTHFLAARRLERGTVPLFHPAAEKGDCPPFLPTLGRDERPDLLDRAGVQDVARLDPAAAGRADAKLHLTAEQERAV